MNGLFNLRCHFYLEQSILGKIGIFISFVKALSGYKKVMIKQQTLQILISIPPNVLLTYFI